MNKLIQKYGLGFTLIELIVSLSILAMILTIAAPRYFKSLDKSKEAVLKEDLYVMRDAINKFYSDKHRYPDSLEDLVKEKYIRDVPLDPFTQSKDSWVVIPPDISGIGNVRDVFSSAPNKASDGSWYKDW